LGSKKIRNLPIPKECFIELGGWLGYELWQENSRRGDGKNGMSSMFNMNREKRIGLAK
jgi:hypothetical protein